MKDYQAQTRTRSGAGGRRDFFDREFVVRLDRLHIAAKRLAGGAVAGARRSRRIGDGLEFADHRAYTSGDDVRFIDWPYYARMERLMLRLFHTHSESGVAILLDASGSMSPGGEAAKFDYARRVTAALAYVAMGSLDCVTIRAFSAREDELLRVGRNRRRIFEVLEFLSGLTAGGRTALPEAVEKFTTVADRPATVIIISDLLDCEDVLADSLARLRLGGSDATVIHLWSPADARGPADGALLLRQAESGEEMPVTVTEQLLSEYRKCRQGFAEDCRRICLGAGSAYVGVCTDAPFERMVLQTLRRAGVLAG